MTTRNKKINKVTKKCLFRTVASSTAIETGSSVSEIEAKLKDKKSKFHNLSLA
ncbi:MAG: hypothetical protein WBM99_14710 [Psychromonas sp.]